MPKRGPKNLEDKKLEAAYLASLQRIHARAEKLKISFRTAVIMAHNIFLGLTDDKLPDGLAPEKWREE
jgi:DNA-binding transcriptional regulator PaaX